MIRVEQGGLSLAGIKPRTAAAAVTEYKSGSVAVRLCAAPDYNKLI